MSGLALFVLAYVLMGAAFSLFVELWLIRIGVPSKSRLRAVAGWLFGIVVWPLGFPYIAGVLLALAIEKHQRKKESE